MTRYYVGLACTCHDPAMAIVADDGEVLYAEAIERPLQHKRAWDNLPDNLLWTPEVIRRYCDPGAEFVLATSWSRKVYAFSFMQYMSGLLAPLRLRGAGRDRASMTLMETYKMNWMTSTLFSSMRRAGSNFILQMRHLFGNNRVSLRHYPHHLSHAAAACYTSPFEEAVCAVFDGFGEFGSHSFYRYERGDLIPIKEVKGYGSLGFLYGRLTELCGFDWFKGEDWKMMGLAPYGQVDSDIYDRIMSMIKVDGLTMKFARSASGLDRGMRELQAEHGRKPGSDPLSVANLARTSQQVFCDLMGHFLTELAGRGISDNLVLSGGCALNSAFNGRALELSAFARLHVPCAPADDGNALGAAWLALRDDHPHWRPKKAVHSPYLGSELSATTLANLLRFGRIRTLRHFPDRVHLEAARLLSQGKLIGWIQGRAEFGPRALGNRSIVADPRSPTMKDTINALVKFREEFRPFAPSILHEHGDAFFDNYQESPYMERTLRFRSEVRDKVPAVVHFDQTGRLQSVKREWNPRYYDLIKAFYDITGIPLVLNTSFNIMGKPIAHSVEDAIALFYTTGLDALVIGDYLIEKDGNSPVAVSGRGAGAVDLDVAK